MLGRVAPAQHLRAQSARARLSQEALAPCLIRGAFQQGRTWGVHDEQPDAQCESKGKLR